MGLELERNGKPVNGVTARPVVSSLDREWLAKWMGDISAASRPKKKRAVHFVLAHIDGDRGHRNLAGADLEAALTGADRDARIATIVDNFDRSSQMIANGCPRQASFLVQAFRTDDPDQLREEPPIDSLPFAQTPDPVISKGAPGVERATDPVAMAGHLQRIADDTLGRLTQMADLIIQHTQKTQEECVSLRQLSWNQQVQNQQLLDARMTREAEAADRAMMRDMTGRAMIFAMNLGKSWMASKLNGGVPDTFAAMNFTVPEMVQHIMLMRPDQRQLMQPKIQEMLASLMPEEQQALIANATPELRAILGLPEPPRIAVAAEEKKT